MHRLFVIVEGEITTFRISCATLSNIQVGAATLLEKVDYDPELMEVFLVPPKAAKRAPFLCVHLFEVVLADKLDDRQEGSFRDTFDYAIKRREDFVNPRIRDHSIWRCCERR